MVRMRSRKAPRIADFAEMGRPPRTDALQGKRLVSAGEAIFEAETKIAAESRIAQGVLVLFVEKIGGARVKRNAAAEVVVRGDIEARVTWISGEAEPEKICVRANTGEVAANRDAETTISGVQSERAGMDGTPSQVVSGKPRRIEGVGSRQ